MSTVIRLQPYLQKAWRREIACEAKLLVFPPRKQTNALLMELENMEIELLRIQNLGEVVRCEDTRRTIRITCDRLATRIKNLTRLLQHGLAYAEKNMISN